MREIKFRAWDKEKEEFVRNFAVFKDGAFDEYISEFERGIAPDGKYILMQYTGLKDKNSKEIYEGDVVKIHVKGTYSDDDSIDGQKWYDDDFIGDVYFDEKSSGFVFRSVEWFSYIAPHCNKAEIIGNIWDNPELPEENK